MVSLSGLTDLFGTGKPASGAIAATNVIAVPTTSAFKIAGQAYFAGPTYTTSAAALPTTGINLGFSSSITAASATGSLVTYTTAQSNGLAVGQKVTVAGAIPSTYNIKLGIISAIPTVGCTAATGVSNALCTQFTVDFSLSAAGLATAPTADYVGSGYVSGIPDVSTYSTSTGDKDAASAARYVYTQTNYWRADDHNYPGQDTTNAGLGTVKAGTSAFIANTGQWCTTCHTRYLASGSSSRKYSSGDAVFTYRHTSVATKEDSPSCMQCHVAHGSNAAMGVDANGGNAAVNTPNNLAFNAANPAAPTGSQPAPISTSTSSKLLRADNRGVCALCHDGQS
jgi:hypothetical protein